MPILKALNFVVYTLSLHFDIQHSSFYILSVYSKQEATRLKQEFWTRFGQYMKPVTSSSGEKVNWSNYRTGIPHIFFRLRAENNFASIAIELTHPSSLVRHEQFEQIESFTPMFEQLIGAGWTWQKKTMDENGKALSRIFTELHNVSVFSETDWPALISFFKPALIGLDEFWENIKPGFE